MPGIVGILKAYDGFVQPTKPEAKKTKGLESGLSGIQRTASGALETSLENFTDFTSTSFEEGITIAKSFTISLTKTLPTALQLGLESNRDMTQILIFAYGLPLDLSVTAETVVATRPSEVKKNHERRIGTEPRALDRA